jgi:hypothetical protein
MAVRLPPRRPPLESAPHPGRFLFQDWTGGESDECPTEVGVGQSPVPPLDVALVSRLGRFRTTVRVIFYALAYLHRRGKVTQSGSGKSTRSAPS